MVKTDAVVLQLFNRSPATETKSPAAGLKLPNPSCTDMSTWNVTGVSAAAGNPDSKPLTMTQTESGLFTRVKAGKCRGWRWGMVSGLVT